MNTTRLRKTSALKVVLVAAAALILSAGAASAQTSPSGTLDANTLPPECGPHGFSCSGQAVNSEFEEAQTFTAINSGNVTSVQVQVVNPGCTSGDLVVQLATVDSSGAVGPIIPGAAATVPGSEIPPIPFEEPRLVTVSFNNPPAVQAGTKYALLLSSPNSTCVGGSYVWVYADPDLSGTDEYPQGEVFFNRNGGGWERLPFDADMVFAIYVETSTISTLKELVTSLALPAGTSASLQTKLDAALTAENGGDTASACSELSAFINQVQAQAGKKKISAQDAEELITKAQRHQEVLGC